MGRLRIGYLRATDAADRKTWSGTPSFIADTLNKHIGEVVFLGPLKLRLLFSIGDKINFFLMLLFKKRYHYSISVLVSLVYGRVFKRIINKNKLDLLIAPAGYTEFAYLNTTIPIVYCADSTLKQIIDYNPGLLNLLSISIKEMNYIEARAIKKASIICYSSEWAASSAIMDFRADPKKVFVLPFGANINDVPNRDRVINKKKGKICRLLFLGNNWKWKGGSIAFDALIELTRMDIPAELTVCGCKPPDSYKNENLKVIPFLDKNDPAQFKTLTNLFWGNDFLILPTRSDCYGLVFCEASAYGISSFATNTGGVSGVIEEGVNGFLFPFEAGGKEYAAKIAVVYEDENLYNSLKLSSRQLFEKKLNWDVWALRLNEIIKSDIFPIP